MVAIQENEVLCEWLHDQQIIRLAILKASIASVDDWYTMTLKTAQQWQADQPYLALHDFCVAGVTPYTRNRAQEASEAMPTHLTGRVAVIVPDTPLAQLVKVALNVTQRAVQKRIETRLFTEYTHGLAWLEEFLPNVT